ncbi:uncharacterized protein CHSO_1067 [Chryseobacterium sp. StRB126]|uniref:hypothetical protein n=1 Tax=Chryseobacterium sp. StRB126 TaxID=878220 RepID=UPI0004E99173|nr:hypothetical protein [Chryseobacterium sp. StRB126]BAP30104.1 uncharacterized protein CHSO_1067 [Chryseobacterium sp. StRB126]
MNTFKESLLNLLGLKTKEEFAEELHNVLESFKSSIVVKLESEFIFRDSDLEETIGSGCYVAPPAKGEYYITDKAIYEVMQVTHSYRSSIEAGTIQVRKVRDLRSK